jgi:hypothetical protein
MKLEISVEELRKRKLFVATPMYGGQCLGMYMKSCLDLQGICQQHGIDTRFSFIFNESLITRARNYLVDEFLRSGFTHLLFLDADIHFNPQDAIALLALDKDVAGAPYPKKSIKWQSAITATVRSIDFGSAIDAVRSNEQARRDAQMAVLKGDLTEDKVPALLTVDDIRTIATQKLAGPADVEKVVGDYVFNAVAGTGQFSVAEPLEVMEIGTGFMMVKREVFPKWAAQYPNQNYKPDHVGQANFDGTRYIHAFFDCIVDRKRDITIVEDYNDVKAGQVLTVGGSDRYLSEDYMFCQLFRNMGGKIWLCPWMKTHHIGTYAFTGDMQAVAAHVGSL